MKSYFVTAAVCLLVFGLSCKDQGQSSRMLIKVQLEPKSNSGASGIARFYQKGEEIILKATFENLTSGSHAIHLHEKSDCSSVDGVSSGGHWNPLSQPHGKWGDKEGYHKGDIGNFMVDDTGKGAINFSANTDQWCYGCGDNTKDIKGRAIIVHQGEDDFTTQPTGNAGSRVICGSIIE